MVTFYLIYWRITKLWPCKCIFLHSLQQCMWLPISLHSQNNSNYCQWIFKNYCIRPSVYVVVFCFWFAFPLWLMALSIFYVLIDHLYNFFQEISLQILCPFLNWVCLFIVDLCKLFIFLDIKPLSGIWSSDIFSHSVSCLFTFLVVSFEGQMFLLMKFNLYMISVSHAFVFMFKKSLLIYGQRFIPVFSSESYIILCLSFIYILS